MAGAGLVLGFGLPGRRRAAASAAEGAGHRPLAPNPFMRIGTDNLVTVVCKHHEMGQGNLTGLTSLVAEELDADWAQMRSEAAPSDASRYNNLDFGPMQGTGGSSAIANSYLQYRGAGAAARAMLVAAAADAWKVPAAEVTVVQGRARPCLGQARHLRRDGRGGEPAAGAGKAGAEGDAASSPSSARTGRRRGSTRRPSAMAAPSTPSTSSCPAC